MTTDASGAAEVRTRLQNRAGFPEAQLARLSEDLFQLHKVDPDLPDAALRYVVNGTDAGVLLTLSKSPEPGQVLHLAGTEVNYLHQSRQTARAKFFDLIAPDADAAAVYRLAEVYDAAARPCRVAARWQSPLGLPDWLGLFLYEVAGETPNVYSSQRTRIKFPADLAERVVVEGGLPADTLVRAVVLADLKDYSSRYRVHLVTALNGFPALAARHAVVVREGLDAKEAERRVYVLEQIAEAGVDPAPFAERIVELAVSPLKTVRKAAAPLVAKLSDAGQPLRVRAESGSNEERMLALQTLWLLEGEKARPFLQGRAEQEPNAKIKATIAEMLAEQEAVAAATDEAVTLPLIEPIPKLQPLSDDAMAALAAAFREAWQAAKRHHERYPQYKLPPEPTDAYIALVTAFVEGATDDPKRPHSGHLNMIQEPALKFAARPDVSLTHLMRLAEVTGRDNEWLRRNLAEQFAARAYRSRPGGFSLRELAAAMVAAGRPGSEVHELVLASVWQGSPLLEFAPAHVWPYYAEHPQLLAETWESKGEYSFQVDARRRLVFRVLAMFPELPPRYVRMCWDIAFNGSKKERPMAQGALNAVRGKEQRILASLTAGKAEHRAIAADWLGRLGYREAIPDIRKALAKEKNELTAGAMMNALEALGLPLDEFISAEGLLKEAQALIAKGVPKGLEWFSFDLMPKVRWAGSGRQVRREILQWMVLQSHKLGSPEPSPRLRQYTKRFDRGDAEAFGQYVLEAWIGHDTVPHTHEQAHKHAEQHSAQMARGQKTHPQYYIGTPEQWYREAYNQKIVEPVGSANAEKGILAVAGACCGGRAAIPVERYLKTYYGHRVHQCKALLQMLAWIEHPSAIQVLLSVANRFRTAGIRKEADRLVQALAERKDWTVDELADRTIPTGGFEEETGLVLDYGGRKFTASLDAEMSVVLKNDESKVLKALPAPRQGDDVERAKAAKKALSAAKKEIESVLKLQRERLYEAMCTQRLWRFGDWDQFLNKHPVVRHYCQRLVWGVVEESPVVAPDQRVSASVASSPVTRTFRPLADGTLTDTNDDAVTVGPDERVVVAHESRVSAEASKAWVQHFADYNVRPLFDQFGKAGYRPPAGKRDESVVADFRGHLLESFRLRGRLTKLGYTRGAAEDGGWFMTYHKHFASLGITATVEFTGSPLPEENRTVAITDLYFSRSRGDKEGASWGGDANRLTLANVPPVLLSECYNDVRQAAAEGTGFDPDWEKKSQY